MSYNCKKSYTTLNTNWGSINWTRNGRIYVNSRPIVFLLFLHVRVIFLLELTVHVFFRQRMGFLNIPIKLAYGVFSDCIVHFKDD